MQCVSVSDPALPGILLLLAGFRRSYNGRY
jgi:hypothetical protein